jgi:hypothetical protein
VYFAAGDEVAVRGGRGPFPAGDEAALVRLSLSVNKTHWRGEWRMQALFFLIRLPFFVAGVLFCAAIAILALDIGIAVGAVVLFAGVPAWVCVLLPGAVIAAAFSNDAEVLSRFLAWTRDDVVGEAAKWLRTTVTDYFKGYRELWKWLVGAKRA